MSAHKIVDYYGTTYSDQDPKSLARIDTNNRGGLA